MTRIGTNETRYNTEDLDAFLCWVEDWIAIEATQHMAGRSLVKWLPRTIPFGVKYWTPIDTDSEDARQGSVEGLNSSWLWVKGFNTGDYYRRLMPEGLKDYANLHVPSPKNLFTSDLEKLAASRGKAYLPSKVAGQVAVFWYCMGGLDWNSRKELNQSIGETNEYKWKAVIGLLLAACEGRTDGTKPPKIRVEASIQTPVSKRTRTKEEKLYGLHQKVGNTSQDMEGSSSTGQYLWANRVSEASYYYDREWGRREKWAEKIRAMGHECESHETFSEYLLKLSQVYKMAGR